MKQLSIIIMVLVLISGCITTHSVDQPVVVLSESDAIKSLNLQIEKFNADRQPRTLGISPIDQLVSRVRYDPKLNQVISFSKDGKVFLVLKREPSGQYKGILEVHYHELVDSGQDGSHSWGHILAEFYLEKEMFK
jgi:hypothetical protein